MEQGEGSVRSPLPEHLLFLLLSILALSWQVGARGPGAAVLVSHFSLSLPPLLNAALRPPSFLLVGRRRLPGHQGRGGAERRQGKSTHGMGEWGASGLASPSYDPLPSLRRVSWGSQGPVEKTDPKAPRGGQAPLATPALPDSWERRCVMGQGGGFGVRPPPPPPPLLILFFPLLAGQTWGARTPRISRPTRPQGK